MTFTKTVSLNPELSAGVRREIRNICSQSKGVCNAQGKRIKPTLKQVNILETALIAAAHYAKIAIPNRVKSVGRPPNNASIILVDDIIRACKKAGLSPRLRYVSMNESLSVEMFIALQKLLWPASQRTWSPRRLFERWQRNPIVRKPARISRNAGSRQRMLARSVNL